MLAAIKSSGSITIYSFEYLVNPDRRTSVMLRDVNGSKLINYYTASTQITAFKTSKDFLIVGCATCDKYGWIKLYSPEKIRLIKDIPGSIE